MTILADPTEKIKTLGDQFTVLVICPVQKLQDTISDIVRFLTEKNMPGIYVSFSKPYKSLKKILMENNLNTDRIFFIDCISHSMSEPKREDKVLYINNRGDLNSLGIGISQFIETIPGKEFLLIDALETLLIYNKPDTIAMFVQSLIKKSSKFEMKTVILTPRGDKELIDKIGMFFDKIIEVK